MIKALTLSALLSSLVWAHADFPDPPWRFFLESPAQGWEQPNFDDNHWREGHGGFGTRATPGARVGTLWRTEKIWLRRTIELPVVPDKPALYVYHDEDAEVYLNGTEVASFKGYTTEYRVIPLEGEAREALKAGKNLLAVHCRQTTGGQAIDVHVIDADQVPTLPRPKPAERPFLSKLITPWGAKVTPENAWTEYPRPQLVRPQWTNLNGRWNYAITSADASRPEQWDGQILVPFAVESKLSGVQKMLHDDNALWYHRPLGKIVPNAEERLLLHFEACDYHTRIWINDREIGHHTGGHTPFHFDITDAILAEDDAHLYVRVVDRTGGFQLRGKQTPHPRGIWYTQVSGIWGTVWMETVPSTYIHHLQLTTQNDGKLTVTPSMVGRLPNHTQAKVTVRLENEVVAEASVDGFAASDRVILEIPAPRLWSPDSPTLYDLEIHVGDDHVHSYVGIREVGKVQDRDGHWRFTLNGEPIFHWGPLDQGWWPDGLLTPPSDEAMRWDVDYLKAAGFNMIRKHIKIEPRRFYAYCDQIGMMVWQDQPSGGPKPKWTRLAPNPEDATWPDEAHAQYMRELDRMITMLENHPSLVQWVPFNEAWGQHRTLTVGAWTAERDPSRHVNIASGGNFWPVGDIVDAHAYPHPQFPFAQGAHGRFEGFIKVMGEFGGHGLPSPGHLWDDSRDNWGYGGLPQNASEYQERYEESLRLLRELKTQGIAGGVYTQTTDVEGEINGLISYDRKRIKIPAEKLKALHRGLTD